MDNPAIVYVRRNTEQSLGDVDWTSNPNRIIVGWPNEGEPYYEDRPTAGIDAGWDDDDITRPKININSTISAHVTSDNILGFYNLRIETSDDSTDDAIKRSIGTTILENCDINHQRWGDEERLIGFVRIDDTKGKAILKVNKCNMRLNGGLFVQPQDVRWMEVQFYCDITNTNIYNYDEGVFIKAYCNNWNSYINIDNCNINISRPVVWYDGGDNWGVLNVKITNSVIKSRNYSLVYSAKKYKLFLEIEKCVINTSKDSVVNFYNYQNCGSEYKCDIYIRDTKIEDSFRVLHVQNAESNNYSTAIGDFVIENCDIYC